jgi:hypothetical protein
VANKLSIYQTFNLKSCDRFIRRHLPLPIGVIHHHHSLHHHPCPLHHLTHHRLQALILQHLHAGQVSTVFFQILFRFDAFIPIKTFDPLLLFHH